MISSSFSSLAAGLSSLSPEDRATLRNAVISWAERIQTAPVPWVTGIYPAEMAAFLGLCQACGIKSILESGRGPDAYSTHILGMYADLSGEPVVSIDFAPIETMKFGPQLKAYRNLRCLAGSVATVLPKAMPTLHGPVALLIDGPKEDRANCLSLCASMQYHVGVIAHHNATPETPWAQALQRIFPGLFRYEELQLDSDPRWQKFREWEHQAVHGYEIDDKRGFAGRQLDQSSLAMAVVPDRSQLRPWMKKIKPGPFPFKPWSLKWMWKILSIFS